MSRELVRRCLVSAASGLLATPALRAFPYADLCTGAALVAYVPMAPAPLRPAWPVALGGALAWRVALGLPAVVLFAWGVVLPIVL